MISTPLLKCAMPNRTLPWHKLGHPPGWRNTLPDLRQYFDLSWPLVAHYFLPTDHLATSIDCPSPGGPGCPRQVVERGFDDLIAVCGNSPIDCDPLPVARKDLILYELKIDALLADLSALLHVQSATYQKIGHLTWNLGSYTSPGRLALTVFVCLEGEFNELSLAGVPLLNRQEYPLVLLIPSRQGCAASLLLGMQASGISLVALDELAAELEYVMPAQFLAQYAREISLPERDEPENSLQRKGDYWHIRFRGETYPIKQSIGMQYIAHLIPDPKLLLKS